MNQFSCHFTTSKPIGPGDASCFQWLWNDSWTNHLLLTVEIDLPIYNRTGLWKPTQRGTDEIPQFPLTGYSVEKCIILKMFSQNCYMNWLS